MLWPITTRWRSSRRFPVAERTFIEVQSTPIDVTVVLDAVEGQGEGAVVLFLGRVRNSTADRGVTHLDYDAYGEMARTEMDALAREAQDDRGAHGVAIVHRTGRLEIGDIAVAIAVSSPHRPAAYEASRWLIDTLKERVPIWKKEWFSDGAHWVSDRP